MMSGFMRPVHANRPSPRRLVCKGRVNARSGWSVITEIWLDRHDAAMVRSLPMKALVMTAIVCQHHPAELVSAGQNVGIRGSRSAIFLCRQHIMATPAKLLHDRVREILVSVKEHGCHSD